MQVVNRVRRFTGNRASRGTKNSTGDAVVNAHSYLSIWTHCWTLKTLYQQILERQLHIVELQKFTAVVGFAEPIFQARARKGPIRNTSIDRETADETFAYSPSMCVYFAFRCRNIV